MSYSLSLFEAIRAGDAGKVRELLSSDSSLVNARNAQGLSAVLLSSYMGRKEIRDLLIERGANLELQEAVAAGKLPLVKEFVDASPELAKGFSSDGFPFVALAAAFGHEDVVKYLYGNGADINAAATNGTGYNSLTGAVAGSHTSVAKWLVENGAAVNYRYARGHSPFLEAAANGNLEIVKTFVAHGVDIFARTDDGKSALTFAQERGHKELAEYLCGLGLTS